MTPSLRAHGDNLRLLYSGPRARRPGCAVAEIDAKAECGGLTHACRGMVDDRHIAAAPPKGSAKRSGEAEKPIISTSRRRPRNPSSHFLGPVRPACASAALESNRCHGCQRHGERDDGDEQGGRGLREDAGRAGCGEEHESRIRRPAAEAGRSRTASLWREPAGPAQSRKGTRLFTSISTGTAMMMLSRFSATTWSSSDRPTRHEEKRLEDAAEWLDVGLQLMTIDDSPANTPQGTRPSPWKDRRAASSSPRP